MNKIDLMNELIILLEFKAKDIAETLEMSPSALCHKMKRRSKWKKSEIKTIIYFIKNRIIKINSLIEQIERGE